MIEPELVRPDCADPRLSYPITPSRRRPGLASDRQGGGGWDSPAARCPSPIASGASLISPPPTAPPVAQGKLTVALGGCFQLCARLSTVHTLPRRLSRQQRVIITWIRSLQTLLRAQGQEN
ncbi:hypothetical protein COCON_G00204220 [Conger conger]|uniref:Uncharacterized protein n=1 Tax=Conger conger TaxID=82655 RepID=A0A9Q1CYR7_CONCO|nr:hypothetical protein COCON_G00204220 [Conger conger]